VSQLVFPAVLKMTTCTCIPVPVPWTDKKTHQR